MNQTARVLIHPYINRDITDDLCDIPAHPATAQLALIGRNSGDVALPAAPKPDKSS